MEFLKEVPSLVPRHIEVRYPRVALLTARDYSKEKIGMLQPLYRTKNSGKTLTWLVQCDCGEYLTVPGRNLSNKSTTACRDCSIKGYSTWRQEGVPQWVLDKYPEVPIGKAAERNGDKFGRLSPLYRTEPRYEPHWLCKCDCGNYEMVSLHYLVNKFKGTCELCKNISTRELKERLKED